MNRFKLARERNKFTISYVAEKSGVPYTTLWKIENTDCNVGYKQVAKLASFYNVNADWLLGLSDSPSISEDEQTVTKITGLSSDAVKALQIMKEDEETSEIINHLLSSSSFMKALSDFEVAYTIRKYNTESDEEADLIENEQLNMLKGKKSQPLNYLIFSRRQVVDMYIWKATQEINNAFNDILKGVREDGKR